MEGQLRLESAICRQNTDRGFGRSQVTLPTTNQNCEVSIQMFDPLQRLNTIMRIWLPAVQNRNVLSCATN